jgi:hypothetical protein
MIDQHGNYVCDYCTSINGEFYDETGNHVGCQDAAGPIAALREAVEVAREALKVYAARENWWITDGDAIWQEGSADTEPWLIADAALSKLEGAK